MGLERAAKQQGSQLVAALLKGAAAEEPRRGPKSSSSSYKGVTKHRRTGRWEAHIWGRTVVGGPGKQIYLGGFVTPEEAAEAHDIAAVQLQGANAKTNFHLSKYAGFLESRSEKGNVPAILQLRRKASTAKRTSAAAPARSALGVMPPPNTPRRGLRLDSLGSPESDSTQTGDDPGTSTPAGLHFAHDGLEREDSITSRTGLQRPLPMRLSAVLEQGASLRSPDGVSHSLHGCSLTDGPSAFHSPVPSLPPSHAQRLGQGAAQRAVDTPMGSGYPLADAAEETQSSTTILLAQALLRSFGSSTLPAHILESLPESARALLNTLKQQMPPEPVPATQPLRGFPIAQGETLANRTHPTANELPSRPISQSLWTQSPLSGSKREREASPPLPSNVAQGEILAAEHDGFSMPMQPLRGEPLGLNTLQTITVDNLAARNSPPQPQQHSWQAQVPHIDSAPVQAFAATADKIVFPTQPRSRSGGRSSTKQGGGGPRAGNGEDMDTAEALLSLKRSD